MIFRSKNPHKGFFLKNEFRLDSEVAVLTGRNGAGKTRFLEAVSNSIEVLDGERVVSPGKIRFVSSGAMQGTIRNSYSHEDSRIQIGEIFAALKSNLDFYASPLDSERYMESVRGFGSYSSQHLHMIFSTIARKLGKSVRELTKDEIQLYFESPAQAWDVLDIGRLCNEYLRRKRQNSYAMWLAEAHGRAGIYLDAKAFDKAFGEPPWILYGNVLQEIFDGKISLRSPEDELADDVYLPVLIETATGEALSPEALSSGEKNLLWLASTIFNLRFGVDSLQGVPEVILLDEPDAFLHPKMVVKFYSVIQRIAELFSCKVIFTTHSPTTVALAPDDSVYRVTPTDVERVEKDDAISDLLEGVTQISLSSRNRREVFVENKSDANVYRYIFDKIKSKFSKVDPKISLTFFSAGAKMPAGQIEQKLNQFVLGISPKDVQRFIEELNGVGDCGQVVAMVDSLTQAGNVTVRGVIDWDLKNKPRENVVVSGMNIFYTIENIMLNPLYVFRLLYSHSPDKYSLLKYCGRDVSLRDWMDDLELLQASVDFFLEDFLGRPNNKGAPVEFLGGHVIHLDSEYLLCDGHDLMCRVLDRYRELNAWANKDGKLLFELVKIMVDDFGWKHVPRCFDETFSALQR